LLVLHIPQRDRCAAESESRRIAKDSLECRRLFGYLPREALLLRESADGTQPSKRS
jgi:hypothetical protein